MAMLAAPRRKQKVINLRAKNNDWSNDTNKFGQRMLEKMGWSEGKGLGANENGIVEHVVARYKNDDKGLGYEDRSDQWTKHEDDFNSLLANLSNGDNNEEKLHSGVSLEVKSKKSKARVHYHKFTRGKDLTRYSEKDLANIFGKKSLKPLEKQQEESQKLEEVKTTDQVFTDKGSMIDYFKSKMNAFKSKKNMNMNVSSYNNEGLADCGFKGFSATANDHDGIEDSQTYCSFKGFSQNFDDDKSEIINMDNMDIDNSKVEIKKKKKKKNKIHVQTQDESSENLSQENENILENKIKKTKKKKHKSDSAVLEEKPGMEIIESVEEHTEDYVPKKKKKRKHKDGNEK